MVEPRLPDSGDKVADAAVAAAMSGFAVWPPKADGSKRPATAKIPADCGHPACVEARAAGREVGWVHRQHARLSVEGVRHIWSQRRPGVGLICGQVSGGLEMLEFEGRAVADGTMDGFLSTAKAAGLGDLCERIAAGYSERTPSGGVHWLYRCDQVSGNLKLARRPATDEELTENRADKIKVLIETRGEGGFVIVAPSNGKTHPTGGSWELISGGFPSVATITRRARPPAQHGPLIRPVAESGRADRLWPFGR
jgi:hypothetical protein